MAVTSLFATRLCKEDRICIEGMLEGVILTNDPFKGQLTVKMDGDLDGDTHTVIVYEQLRQKTSTVRQYLFCNVVSAYMAYQKAKKREKNFNKCFSIYPQIQGGKFFLKWFDYSFLILAVLHCFHIIHVHVASSCQKVDQTFLELNSIIVAG